MPNRDALTVLHLTGRELSDPALSRIRLMDNLRSLSFHRTNVSHAAMEELFADRPVAAARLLSLNLVDSGVDLAALSDSKTLTSMVSLKALFLPRPIPGNEAEFAISTMPKLKTLSFSSHDRGKNASLMKISVADCQELIALRIGLLQKSSLKLTRLPKLKSIESAQFKTTMRLGGNQSTPGSAWIESIVVDDLPLFEELKFYASELKEMRFTKTSSLRFIWPGVFQVNASGFSSSSSYDKNVPNQATKALVEGLAESDGPEVIDYAAVPIGGADISSLLNNPRLRELYLHDCGLKVADIKKLQGSDTLRAISTQGNELSGVAIGPLISKMPKLERWRGDLYALDRLRLEDHQHIQGVVDALPEESNPNRCHLAYCSAIRLVNLPNWVDPIRLDADIFRHITIKNLPKLRQLIINGPICEGAVLPDQILEVDTLHTLGVDATGWTANQLRKAVTMPMLNHLILSNIHIDPTMSAVLAASGSSEMTRLTLIDSTAGGPAVTALMKQLPNLKLELVRTEIPAVLEGDLFAAKRLIVPSEGDGAPYSRGPEGTIIPIMKQPDSGGGIASQWRISMMVTGMSMMGGMNGRRAFVAMPQELFERLSPEAFEVLEADPETEPIDNRIETSEAQE